MSIPYFKFWCQKVLPLVYDNSLSYYEVLCKVVDKLNDIIANVSQFEDLINERLDTQDALISQYKEDLEKLINDFIDTINNDLIDYEQKFNAIYARCLDLYAKSKQQYEMTQAYVDKAISDFGSIAIWSIQGNNLVATVFNDNLFIAIGMTPNGRLTITTDN